MPSVLIADDEPDVVDLVEFHLQRDGFDVLRAADGLQAVKLVKEHKPDLVVLDIMMPGLDGVGVLKKLRQGNSTRHLPVIMLTARSQMGDRITGLEAGADDYLTKPFSPRELVLRITGLLKRVNTVRTVAQLTVGPFDLDFRNLKFVANGQEIDLTTTEFRLLAMLLEAPGAIHRRSDLLREVWGYSDEVHTRTLDTHMKRLREKLAPWDSCIETIRGVGYRFVLDEASNNPAGADAASEPPTDR